MQEQNEEKTEKKASIIKRISWRNWILGGLFFGTLAGGAGSLLYMYRNLPASAWGQFCDKTPWRGYNCEIATIQTGWKGMRQDSNTTVYLPTIKLTLGNTPGSGTMQVTLYDDLGNECYQIKNIAYQNGSFMASDDCCVETDGKRATITCVVSEPLSAVNMKIYGTSRHARPWKAVVTHIPLRPDHPFEAPQVYQLGQATISPTCFSVSK